MAKTIDQSKTYYVHKREDGRFDLRQTRYAAQLGAGNEHPHDICATGFDADGMLSLLDMVGFKDRTDASALSPMSPAPPDNPASP